jgi:hypothetical protein
MPRAKIVMSAALSSRKSMKAVRQCALPKPSSWMASRTAMAAVTMANITVKMAATPRSGKNSALASWRATVPQCGHEPDSPG